MKVQRGFPLGIISFPKNVSTSTWFGFVAILQGWHVTEEITQGGRSDASEFSHNLILTNFKGLPLFTQSELCNVCQPRKN